MPSKFLASLITALSLSILVPAVALAHVIVTPAQAGIGQELVFRVSVPNERQVPVASVKLLIPSGVSNVIPTLQPGWMITTTSENGQNPEVSSITWSGSIPVGQRDDFSFSAQVPGKASQLDWRAYQTYADGTVVHWDQAPKGSDDAVGTAGPYSVTHVVNDLTGASPSSSTSSNNTLALILSVAALIISIGGLLVRKRR